MTKAVPLIPFESIERRFRLASFQLFDTFHPAVSINGPLGGYVIRVLKGVTWRGADIHRVYDYFELADDGTVLVAPRGYAKDYKPGRITGMDEAVKKYAGVVTP